jgi:hypothetical protein
VKDEPGICPLPGFLENMKILKRKKYNKYGY